MNRRSFLKSCGFGGLAWPVAPFLAAERSSRAEEETRAFIDEHRPSHLGNRLADFPDRVGAAHVAGKYHLGPKPFLLEGAEKLLAFGTRVGKFWFTPAGIDKIYPFESDWGWYPSFVDLAEAPYFRQLFALPFSTFILEAHTPREEGWQSGDQPTRFYDAVTAEFYSLAVHLYRKYGERSVTFVLQHWEGDWLLRGRGGELWNPAPANWPERGRAMVKWLAARQAGVSQARAEFGARSKCTVAHAAEVNRVVDAWNDVPTMTRHVLPEVELDLVSYSCYDALRDPLTLWKCIAEIRRCARTNPSFGPRSIYIGEIGIPENDQPENIVERWDRLLGVCLASDMRYVVQWELYCNEFGAKVADHPHNFLVTDPKALRGFWLIKPDGSLGECGKYLNDLWKSAAPKPASSNNSPAKTSSVSSGNR